MSRDTGARLRGTPAAGVAAPADRRFRRSDVAPHRRRRHGRAWMLARWTGVAAVVILLAGWGADRIAASDLFLVREIAVRGNSRLSAGEIEQLLGGLRDEHVFDVDLEQYRQRALESSWVEQASLSRILPSTIVVDVVERTPLVIARRDQQLYLVDQTGKIIDDYGAAYHDLDLPIVDGLFESMDSGDVVPNAERVALAAALFDGLGDRQDLRRRLSQIDVSNARDVVVMFEDDPAWLHLGQERFADRLQRYLDLRGSLQDRFGALDYVDLKFDERVYVRGERTRAARAAVP